MTRRTGSTTLLALLLGLGGAALPASSPAAALTIDVQAGPANVAAAVGDGAVALGSAAGEVRVTAVAARPAGAPHTAATAAASVPSRAVHATLAASGPRDAAPARVSATAAVETGTPAHAAPADSATGGGPAPTAHAAGDHGATIRSRSHAPDATGTRDPVAAPRREHAAPATVAQTVTTTASPSAPRDVATTGPTRAAQPSAPPPADATPPAGGASAAPSAPGPGAAAAALLAGALGLTLLTAVGARLLPADVRRPRGPLLCRAAPPG